jgi:hypothetical protein
VEWNDINKTKPWVNYFGLSLTNPKPITFFKEYLTQYCRSNKAVDIARMLKVSANPAGIKYKFGIQLSKGIKNSMEPDKKNGNQLL